MEELVTEQDDKPPDAGIYNYYCSKITSFKHHLLSLFKFKKKILFYHYKI
jgi:hypothetical protein